MKMLKVEWKDSYKSTVAWEFKEDMKPLLPSFVVSVGFVLDETDDYITLLQSDSVDQVCGRLTIPKGCITATQEL